MLRDVFYILFGYICGSILFARVFGRLIKKKDIISESKDNNPGTANAFMYGGFLCGVLTLIGDLLKGIIPVYLYFRGNISLAGAFVIAAPVIGHVFPLFFNFNGGKGIATTFGSLLGLLPNYIPLIILAAVFVFFSVVLRISPHYYRTVLTYFVSEIAIMVLSRKMIIILGFTMIFAAVITRMFKSKEEREPFEVELLWMH